jgi:hypothetical protein
MTVAWIRVCPCCFDLFARSFRLVGSTTVLRFVFTSPQKIENTGCAKLEGLQKVDLLTGDLKMMTFDPMYLKEDSKDESQLLRTS